jgi:hypothetical protein
MKFEGCFFNVCFDWFLGICFGGNCFEEIGAGFTEAFEEA